MNEPDAAPHPADVERDEATREFKRRLAKASECEARWLRTKRMMTEAYKAAFDKSFPPDAGATSEADS